MKIILNECRKQLGILASISRGAFSLPILSSLLIETEGEHIFATANNLEIALKLHLAGVVTDPGKVLLPASKFAALAAVIDGDLTIQGSEILTSSGNYSFLTLPISEFPDSPFFFSQPISLLDSRILQEVLSQSTYAASTEQARYYLACSRLRYSDSFLSVVSTDGARLASAVYGIETEDYKEVLIPPAVTKLFSRLFDSETVSLAVNDSNTQMTMWNDSISLCARLIEGSYPKTEQIIPGENPILSRVNRPNLLSALKRVVLFARKNKVILTFTSDALNLHVEAPEVGFGDETLPAFFLPSSLPSSFRKTAFRKTPFQKDGVCEQVGDGLCLLLSERRLSIAFDIRFLSECLSAIPEETIVFELKDSLSACIIRPVEQADNIKSIHLIMPMRLDA